MSRAKNGDVKNDELDGKQGQFGRHAISTTSGGLDRSGATYDELAGPGVKDPACELSSGIHKAGVGHQQSVQPSQARRTLLVGCVCVFRSS